MEKSLRQLGSSYFSPKSSWGKNEKVVAHKCLSYKSYYFFLLPSCLCRNFLSIMALTSLRYIESICKIHGDKFITSDKNFAPRLQKHQTLTIWITIPSGSTINFGYQRRSSLTTRTNSPFIRNALRRRAPPASCLQIGSTFLARIR